MSTRNEIEVMIHRIYSEVCPGPTQLRILPEGIPQSDQSWETAPIFHVIRADGKIAYVRRKDIDDQLEQNVAECLRHFGPAQSANL